MRHRQGGGDRCHQSWKNELHKNQTSFHFTPHLILMNPFMRYKIIKNSPSPDLLFTKWVLWVPVFTAILLTTHLIQEIICQNRKPFLYGKKKIPFFGLNLKGKPSQLHGLKKGNGKLVTKFASFSYQWGARLGNWGVSLTASGLSLKPNQSYLLLWHLIEIYQIGLHVLC